MQMQQFIELDRVAQSLALGVLRFMDIPSFLLYGEGMDDCMWLCVDALLLLR